MTDYPYTKSGVNIEILQYEIKKDADITTELTGVTYNEPEDLIVSFVSELTAPEETALNDLVENHSGGVLSPYRLLCEVCQDYIATKEPTIPVVCPICDSDQITEIVQQSSFQRVPSPNGMLWEHFQADDGTLVIAKDAT